MELMQSEMYFDFDGNMVRNKYYGQNNKQFAMIQSVNEVRYGQPCGAKEKSAMILVGGEIRDIDLNPELEEGDYLRFVEMIYNMF